MDTHTPHISPQQLSVSDLRSFGDRFGIDYHFSLPFAAHTDLPVLRGKVEELPLPSGLHLTHSSLDVLQPYETLSTRGTAIFLLIVLEGCVRLTIAGQQYVAEAGMAITTHLDKQSTLQATHAPKQHLRTLTVALDISPTTQTKPAWLPEDFLASTKPATKLWHVPGHLHQSLQHWQALQPAGALQQRLLLEGLALQLLAYGLDSKPAPRPPAISPGERKRLEAVRQRLDLAPDLDYSVDQLAAQAAMSTSSFRSKFRLMFGVPVLSYLRNQRLELARQYLLQGHSVQQAAHLSGYRYTTNFATAFRKHYGVSPNRLS
ncbi:MAG: helix-turn-helix transcriptional regulator [Castellaniella sp.]